jgi:hypothetical protein
MQVTWSSLFVLAMSAATATEPQSAMHDHAAMERLGSVTLQTSCNKDAQSQFNRAVALMHSFQFGSAIDGFRSVLAADPTCAMAYWGIALSSWGNPFAGFKSPTQLKDGRMAVEQGLALAPKTKREQQYIDAVAALYVDHEHADHQQAEPPSPLLAYESAMSRLADAYPEDTEARIFYALALAAAADPEDKTYAKQLKAGAILERLFAQFPNHPGLAHYIIHAYDEPALASRAAEAARRYGQIAPSTPHALHMPSHTFTRIGDWQASIDTNLASASAARAADQPADVLHASDYLIYAYLQTGQDQAAKELLGTLAGVFAHFDPAHATGAAPASAAYFAHAAMPARYALERRAWAEAAKLEITTSRFPFADAITYFARGLGAAHLKDDAAAHAAIISLDRIHDSLVKADEMSWAGQVDIQRREIAAVLAYATGHVPEALNGLRATADAEDKTQLASVTPGPLVPARETLGEFLLDAGRPAEALREFEASLRQEPNRFWSLDGAAEAAKASGNEPLARTYIQKLQTQCARADSAVRQQLDAARKVVRP